MTLEDQKFLSVLTSSKKKINIVKIRTNSMNSIVKRVFGQFLKHHGQKGSAISMRIGTSRMKITSSQSASQFQNLCCNTDLPSFLRCQNYSELETPRGFSPSFLRSFKIFVAILTFLAFYVVKITVSLGGFSPSFLSIGIKS